MELCCPVADADGIVVMKRWFVASAVLPVLAVVAIGLALPDTDAARAAYDVTIVATAVATWIGARRATNDLRAWSFVAAGVTCWAVGDLIWDAYGYLSAQRPDVSAADGFYLAGYPLLALGIVRMVRLRAPGRYREGLLDGMAFATAATIATWQFLVVPSTRETSMAQAIVWGAYPLADVLLLAGFSWLVLSPGRRTLPTHLFLAFLVGTVALDFAYVGAPIVDPEFQTAYLDAGFPVTYVLLAFAALHPSSFELTEHGPAASTRMHPARFLLLGAALLTAPSITIATVAAWSLPARSFLFAASMLLAATVLWRFLIAVREREAAQDELAHRATHDDLTGLHNRPLLLERLQETLARARRLGLSVGLLYIDLDRFKPVNDRYGHSAGDEVLVEVAHRLRAITRPQDVVARLGGDEFVVVCADVLDVVDVQLVANRVVEELSHPIEITNGSVTVSASVGITVAASGAAPEEMLQDADTAMYLAKQRGRGRHEQYDPSLRALSARRAQLEAGLRGALDDEQFTVHYQPIIDIFTDEVAGFEALLRWEHPHQGLVEAGAFMDIAEETGLIVPIGEWVLGQACRKVARWNADATDGVWISVNVSPRQFAREDFAATVERMLASSGAEPARLMLEITEAVLVRDLDYAVRQLRAIADLGVRIAVDDFGTGYSALAYLRQFPINVVKIDRQFARDLGTNAPSSTLVAAIVQLAHVLGHSVVAEGVEEPFQAAALRATGCDFVQGFLYAAALHPDDAAEVARTRRLPARDAPVRV